MTGATRGPNYAVEQAADPSRSWRGSRSARSSRRVGQERSVSPLLTAGVRYTRERA
jgi:hypothetical protein